MNGNHALMYASKLTFSCRACRHMYVLHVCSAKSYESAHASTALYSAISKCK